MVRSARRSTPADTFEFVQAVQALLFLDESTIRPRDARVFEEGRHHEPCRGGVVCRAVSVLQGDTQPLRHLAERVGPHLAVLAGDEGGEVVSSSRIRDMLTAGDVAEAARQMGVDETVFRKMMEQAGIGA